MNWDQHGFDEALSLRGGLVVPDRQMPPSGMNCYTLNFGEDHPPVRVAFSNPNLLNVFLLHVTGVLGMTATVIGGPPTAVGTVLCTDSPDCGIRRHLHVDLGPPTMVSCPPADPRDGWAWEWPHKATA